MNEALHRQVWGKAAKVRRRAQVFARQFEYCRDLEGLCAVASGLLLPELQKLGEAYIAFSPFHAFCLMGEDTVVDVTATQFGSEYPRVLICPLHTLPSTGASDVWHWVKRFTTLKDAHAYQLEIGWPPSQRIFVNGLTSI